MPKEKATELEYLKFFYENVKPSLGPADTEIIQSLAKEFKRKTGKDLPDGYSLEDG